MSELRDDVASGADEVKKLLGQAEHADKAAAAARNELRELVKASPELTRQLTAAG